MKRGIIIYGDFERGVSIQIQRRFPDFPVFTVNENAAANLRDQLFGNGANPGQVKG